MSVPDIRFDGPAKGRPIVALAHGAGAPMDSGFMNDVAAGLAAHGLRVARFEFPYMAGRRAGGPRRGPDRPPVLEATWHAVVEALGGGAHVVVGGKSMGGRIATMIADDAGARGAVVFGYPFHPPGRPAQLRTAHLERLRTPALILQGERDTFGTRAEVEGYALSKAISLQWIPDGDHSFKPRAKSGHTLEANVKMAIEAAAAFVKGLR